jgi:hypothetical protein
MNRLPPLRERTAEQLRDQARACRNSAESAGEKEATMLLRLAERYEALADLNEAVATEYARPLHNAR